jgi:NACHT N-terminal Helical domain 1/NACHT domain
MPDLVIGLAAAIVKGAVTVWLKDDAFGASLSTSVIDLISARVPGELDRRKARRFFEDLEVPVAKRLGALRDTEYARMPDNEWNAAVIAAGITFDRAQLTARDLLTKNLNPVLLEPAVRASNRRATRDLSADGTALYDRLISDGCEYLVNIADGLPHFRVHAFAEVLERDHKLLSQIEELLDRVPSRAEGYAREADFVTQCRRHIVRRMDRLELFGLDFESQRYPVSVAYVSLRTDQAVTVGGLAIEDRLASSSRVLLLGRAGSGKTTVLQWLSVTAARSGFTGALGDLNEHFPFFIRLRDYAGRQLPEPEGFLDGLARQLAAEAPSGWIRRQLKSGRAFVLVDGADELPEKERRAVPGWLADLADLYPEVRYVITARPTAVADNWLADLGFTRSSLEAMPPSLIEIFVRNWHNAVRQSLGDEEEIQRLTQYERSLLAEITRDHYLRDLAGTPLLAGLLCALNQNLRSQLPRRRTEIYERALAMFDQRDRARDIPPSAPDLDLTAKTQVLAHLAIWMVRNQQPEVDFATAEKRCSESLAMLGGDYHPTATFRFLLERSGLLREPAIGRVDFIHRTFEEYLAAKAAIDGDAVGELVSKAGDAQWSEVITLAAGQANQAQSAQLIHGLVARGRGPQSHGRRVLAVACLQEIRALGTTLRGEVEAVIPELLPPRSMDQAEQLARAGDRLIPLLAAQWQRTRSRPAESIRAASLVGGSAALDVIRQIALDPGPTRPDAELSRAWQYFDADDYARSVLAPAGVRELRITAARCLSPLVHLSSVEQLEIAIGAGEGVRLPPLAGLDHLDRLTFGDAGTPTPSDLSALAGARVKDLRFWYYPHQNLTQLPVVPEMTQLWLGFPLALTGLTGIERQPRLAQLTLLGSKSGAMPSLAALSELPGLTSLALHALPEIDLLGFSTHNRAMTVSFGECGEVDLAPLAGAENLTIYRHAGTRLRNAGLLGPGSSVRNLARLSGIWPFS